MAPRKGAWAEEEAARWLISQGAEILKRNYAIVGAEIDLILRDEGFVAFAEVKSSQKEAGCRVRVTPAKQKRICRAALKYAAEQNLLSSPLRFDVLEVTPRGIVWLKNAFPYQESPEHF